MRRALAALAATVACGVALVLAGADGGGEQGQRWTIVLDNAFGLTEGGDFKVGGVRAGRITELEVVAGEAGPPRAHATVETNVPGVELTEDASCRVRLQSLIGEYFVDCEPGSSRRPLVSGGIVPVERTESTIPADLVNDIMRRPTRERLRVLLTSLGLGVAGRPEDIQALLERAHPGIRETRKVLRVLGEQQEVIDAFIGEADTVVTDLDRNRRDVVRFVREAGRTGEIAASRAPEIERGIERLPGFLGELRPAMVELEQLADRGSPLADGLRRAAPSLRSLLERLAPFAREARPALRALGDAAVPTSQAVREGREEVRELRALAAEAPALGRPLRQFLQTMDDRRRAIEDDPRAGRTGPPAPDPTHTTGDEGFTGFEAIANYSFWQTLTTNGFDDLGHQLRVPVVADEQCGSYTNRSLRDEEDRRFYERCNAWIGPNQPGLTSPDPSEPNVAARARAGRRPARIGERRGENEPEAGPLPGQRDISRPNPVLPPAVGDLLLSLEQLSSRVRSPDPDAARPLLDFLLGP